MDHTQDLTLVAGTEAQQSVPDRTSPLARRSVLAMGVGAVAAVAVGPAAAAAAPSATPMRTATWLGKAPDAALKSGWAGSLRTLFPHQGRLYYGYGDYGVNSGSQGNTGTNISYYNRTTNTFDVALTAFRTEQIMAYRRIDGGLYVANVDPSTGAVGGGNCYATDDGAANARPGLWSNAAGGAPVEHAFDVCGGATPGERFLCGSTGGAAPGAVIWRSTNHGATWTEFFREPEAAGKVDGYERFYWLARIGNSMYCRANLGPQRKRTAPMRRYDLVTRRWSTLSDRKLTIGGTVSFAGGWSGPLVLGDARTVDSANVVAHGSSIYFRSGSAIHAFNGTTAAAVTGSGGSYVAPTVGDDGHLYVMTSSQQVMTLYRVLGTVATAVVSYTGPIGRTADGHAELGALSIAVMGGTWYVGTAEANLFAVPLPA